MTNTRLNRRIAFLKIADQELNPVHIFKRFKNFLATVFIGGLLAILPIVIIFKIFSWIFTWIIDFIQPFTTVIAANIGSNLTTAKIVATTAVILSCFLIGILVKTAWGKWLQSFTERWFLKKIPGYTTLKEIFNQFQPDNKQNFSRPVLITLDQGANYLTGFVTDMYDGNRYSVFIPTSPSPVNGFVVQTTSDNIKFIDAPSDAVMRSVLSCGVGVSKFVGDLNKPVKSD